MNNLLKLDRRLTFFSILLSLISNFSFGQNTFYTKDTTTEVGVKLIDGGRVENALWCQVKKGNIIEKYSPQEVSKYRFDNGQTYVSKEIPGSGLHKRFFLEQLTTGKITLYYLAENRHSTFYIEKDSSAIIELAKDKNSRFRANLLNLTNDCDNISNTVRLAHYNRNSLKKVIQQYNSCELKPFPFLRYGLIVGNEASTLSSGSGINKKYVNKLKFPYSNNLTLGLFIDAPILVSDFSLHLELYYAQHGYSVNQLIENSDVDFVANTTSFKIPFLLKYTIPKNKLRPFFNVGAIDSYNLKNTNQMYDALIIENVIEINEVENVDLISKNQVGFAAGGGIELPINFKHSIFFELRYHYFFNAKRSQTLNESNIYFTTGFNL